MHQTALQRYVVLLQHGAWLQHDTLCERKRQRCIMWKLPNGQVKAEALMKDDFRRLIGLLNLRRVEESEETTRFIMG
jgi:hypothetical protein